MTQDWNVCQCRRWAGTVCACHISTSMYHEISHLGEGCPWVTDISADELHLWRFVMLWSARCECLRNAVRKRVGTTQHLDIAGVQPGYNRSLKMDENGLNYFGALTVRPRKINIAIFAVSDKLWIWHFRGLRCGLTKRRWWLVGNLVQRFWLQPKRHFEGKLQTCVERKGRQQDHSDFIVISWFDSKYCRYLMPFAR